MSKGKLEIQKNKINQKYKKNIFGQLAQLEQRLVRNQEIGGSNPPLSTINPEHPVVILLSSWLELSHPRIQYTLHNGVHIR